MHRNCALVAMVFSVGLLQACSSDAPTHFYTLDPILTPANNPVTKREQPRVIGIGPVALPALLNRKGIVTRSAQPDVDIAETQQWAEPLLDNVTRVISRNLANLQPQDIIYAYPWALLDAVHYRVAIDVLQFDAQLGQSVTFEAVWTIKTEQQQHVSKRGHTRISHPLPSQEIGMMVKLMDQILAEFSTQLSADLQAY